MMLAVALPPGLWCSPQKLQRLSDRAGEQRVCTGGTEHAYGGARQVYHLRPRGGSAILTVTRRMTGSGRGWMRPSQSTRGPWPTHLPRTIGPDNAASGGQLHKAGRASSCRARFRSARACMKEVLHSGSRWWLHLLPGASCALLCCMVGSEGNRLQGARSLLASVSAATARGQELCDQVQQPPSAYTLHALVYVQMQSAHDSVTWTLWFVIYACS